MKLKSLKLAPSLIALGVVGFICFLQLLPTIYPRFNVFQSLEMMSYDWRIRQSQNYPQPVATNLAAVFIDDQSLQDVNDAFKFSWPWPRQLQGRIVRELSAEGAKAVGFDILFSELHPVTEETSIKISESEEVSSDDFFAIQLARAKNVALAVMGDGNGADWRALLPNELFRTNALSGHITSETDMDGVLRRVLPFRVDPEFGRIWALGIVLAAEELKLDLEHPIIEPGRITLNGTNGVQRVIPLDREGFLYVNWKLDWNDPRLTKLNAAIVINFDALRQNGTQAERSDYINDLKKEGLTKLTDSVFKDKIVVIGCTGSGNNVSDQGATPLAPKSYLVSKHWNVANSILTGNFIEPSTMMVSLLIIGFLGIFSGICTWELRPLTATLLVLLSMVIYVLLGLYLFIEHRYWIPLVLPVGGALLMTHVAIVTYRVIFEQNERRRVKAVFKKIVSPDVVNELLGSEKLSLGGARREITVYFADIRGFTEFTNAMQLRAEQYVAKHNLATKEADQHFDEVARESLATVNLYLSTIADSIKKHDGTLDKYIGDCVMGFWGAPMANPKHAVCCVRAAVDAQRSMYKLNQERFAENKRREQENITREASNQRLLDPLPLLSLGSGINSGTAIVGLMGSEAHIFNYTVFGREVNLASRLESVSGRGRIIISEASYKDILRDDPEMAATCVKLEATQVKGFKDAIEIYEVPWKPKQTAESAAFDNSPANNPKPSKA